jgi:hypothetical protein
MVRATWDEEYMADLMRRVWASYEGLREVLVLFPTSDQDLAALKDAQIAALITYWWPRWVEFYKSRRPAARSRGKPISRTRTEKRRVFQGLTRWASGAASL